MTADDLERHAIIAAHKATCPDRDGCGHHPVGWRDLTKSEKAIVEAWRADRNDYQGRYETAHESFLASERDRDASEAAAAKKQQHTALADEANEQLGRSLDEARREHDDFLEKLDHALGLDDGEEARYSNPEGSAESIYLDVAAAHRAELAEANAKLDRTESVLAEWKRLGRGDGIHGKQIREALDG